MVNYYIRRILDEASIGRIRNLINNADSYDLWTDGRVSVSDAKNQAKSVKSNYELSDLPTIVEVNNLIMASLDKDIKFSNFTAAKSSHTTLISKTISGGFYHPHIDMWNAGDFSTTVFLNSPDEYTGGELCLLLGGLEETKFKLDPGWAITYPTGTVHRVNEVLTGTRYASIFWTESLIKDSFIRQLFYEISCCIDLLSEGHSVHLKTCHSANDDPIFKLNLLKSQILRKYSMA